MHSLTSFVAHSEERGKSRTFGCACIRGLPHSAQDKEQRLHKGFALVRKARWLKGVGRRMREREGENAQGVARDGSGHWVTENFVAVRSRKLTGV